MPTSYARVQILRLLKYFSYEHLPEHLQKASRPFCELAHELANTSVKDDEECLEAMRYLRIAKDAAVRAVV